MIPGTRKAVADATPADCKFETDESNKGEENTMNVRMTKRVLAVAALMAAGSAAAQTPLTFSVAGANLTVYGDVDLYLNYMHSSSGKKIVALQDGAYLRTRLGVRGDKDVGNGYAVKFTMEQGLNDTSGAQADPTRLFDRQAWIGLASPVGEFRVGRQNTIIFYKGGFIDNTARTLGSVVNAFGVPSRYDSDLAYIAPRIGGFQFEGHYSLQGSVVDHTSEQGVYQLGLDFESGPFKLGYANIIGKPATGAAVSKDIYYHNAYANYNYGKGRIYFAYVRSNNNGTTGTGTGLLFNGGSPLSNVGNNLVTGADPGANTRYDIPQISADYQVTKALRIGGLYGKIRDKSGTGKNANGWNVAAYYDVFKDTMLYFLVDSLKNDPNAGFRPAGSAGLTKPFTAAADVNGRTINGAQVGFVYRF
jgi:predicted porin